MREIVVLLHPVLIETTSKNNNKQTRVRRLLRLGVVLDWIAFMKLLGVGKKEIKIYFTFYLTITKRSCIFAPRFGRNIKGNKQ
jgi:hypothetical protein